MMNKTITLYNKPGCGQCMFTKKFLEKNQITFIEKDIQKSAQALEEVKNLGYASLPVVVIDGQESFSGYQSDRLQALVG